VFNGTDNFTVPEKCADGGLDPSIHTHPRTRLSLKAKCSEVRCASSPIIPCDYLLRQCVPLSRLSFICTSSLAFNHAFLVMTFSSAWKLNMFSMTCLL